MPVTPGYYIVSGWVSRAELYLNGLEISAFPTQTDMTFGRQWIRPGNAADILKPARLIDTPMGSRFAYGGIVWQWPMVNLSPKMVSYIQTTYFQPNGPPTNFFMREWSNKLTVQTFNRASGEWETYQAWGRFADFTNEATPVAGGYTDLAINFTAFRVAPDGPDLTPSVSIQEPTYENVEFTTTFSLSNVGDETTISNSQWDIVIPTGTELSGIITVYPTLVEYSTDSGSNYSATPPTPLSSTTNLRGTLSTELPGGDATDDYSLLLIPTSTGNIDVTVTSSTDGDQNDANDSATDSTTVQAFSPAAFSPTVWLDANESVTNDSDTDAADTDPVKSWGDQSGNSNSVEQTTPALQPTYVANAANGNAGIDFNGVDQYMFSTTANLPDGEMTWFIVIDPAVLSSGGEAFVSSGYILYHQAPVNSEDNVGVETSSTAYEFGLATANLQLLTFAVDQSLGNPTLVYRDGSLLSDASASSYTSSTDFSIASSSNAGANYYEGVILEIIAYDSILSTNDRQLVEDYLITKYAIP